MGERVEFNALPDTT